MTDEERLNYVSERRKRIEQDMRDAEILMGLCKKHLQLVDEELKQISACMATPLALVRPKGVHINARRTTPEEQQRIIGLYVQDGASLSQICVITQCSKTTVLRILRHANVQFRSSYRKPDGVALRQNRVIRMN